MKTNFDESPWKIPQVQIEHFTEEHIERALKAINQLGSGDLYVVDFYSQKIVVDSPSSILLCGYAKDVLKQKQLAFFDLILTKEELLWKEQVESAALNVYRAYPLELRADLVLSYDLEVVTKDKEALVLHHKITPFRMCCRGNLWLQLCHVALSSSQRKENVAELCNAVSGDRYLLEGGHFVLSQPLRFTEEEYKILRWILQEYTDKQMCFLLGGMSLNTFKSKKKRLFTKLGVKSMAGAIHKAHLLGLV